MKTPCVLCDLAQASPPSRPGSISCSPRSGARSPEPWRTASLAPGLPPSKQGRRDLLLGRGRTQVSATPGAGAAELHAACGEGERARGGCRQRDLVQRGVLDVQDAPAGEAMEVVMDGRGRLEEQAALQSCEPEDLAN